MVQYRVDKCHISDRCMDDGLGLCYFRCNPQWSLHGYIKPEAICRLLFARFGSRYEYKFGKVHPDFVIKCCETVLKYQPVNVNAMLTKAETQKQIIDEKMKILK